MSLYNTNKSLEKEKDVLRKLLDMPISGLISFPIESYENLSNYSRFLFENIPMVFIDRPLAGLDVPYVASDNKKGMRQMTEYLIHKGHRRIAFLCDNIANRNERYRFNGYTEALIKNKIEPKYK